MVELLVMRHAKSAWDTGAYDFDRPLNERGVATAQSVAQWICDEDLCPDLVISSSAARTRATVGPIVEACGLDDFDVIFRRSLYLADVDDWMNVLWNQTVERLLICGHNPGIDELVIELVGSMPPLTAKGKLMTTAAVAVLDIDGPWDRLAPASATLRTLRRSVG